MVVFSQKRLYSGKSGCIRIKVVVFGQVVGSDASKCCIRANGCIRVFSCGCIRAKMIFIGQCGCIRVKLFFSCIQAEMVVIGLSGCIREGVVVFGQGGCFRKKWL